jgi:hypothetical protein
MPTLPAGIVTAISGKQVLPHLKQVYLVAIDTAEGEELPWDTSRGGGSAAGAIRGGNGAGGTKIALQYWPESLTDSRGSEWNPRNIPGGSHPIYQWARSGERRLSFTAVFARDHEPEEETVGGLAGAVQSLASDIGLGPEGGDPAREPPIEAAVSWLRYFTYPLYRPGEIRVHEPPKALLVFSGSSLSHDGRAGLVTVMTGCEVTYEAWFPNGSPRIVEVALEFAEVVQEGNSVKFHSRHNMQTSAGATALKVNDGVTATSDPFKTTGRVL